MNPVVIFYSKTGNTRTIAEVIARELPCEAFALNLVKKGRLSKQENALEKAYFCKAQEQAQDADLVIIGTPTEFRKPHPMVADFIQHSQIKQAAAFCTYFGMLGGTLLDMEALLRKQGAALLARSAFRLGSEDYRFRQNVHEYTDSITELNLKAAREFARRCTANPEPIPGRMTGVCGNNCTECELYLQQECQGAGYNCWTGRECDIFKCCVTKKSLPDCGKCGNLSQCNLNQKRSLHAPPLQ
jgi:flavodoxin